MIKKILNEISYAKKTIKNFRFFRFSYDFFIKRRRNHIMRQEYYAFDLYNKTILERKEYIYDYEVMKNIPTKYNAADDIIILNDKSKFNEKFKKYLGRDFLLINKNSKEIFTEFIKKHKNIIVKPLEFWGGYGIKKYYNCDENIFDDLISKYNTFLIEELFVQCDEMSSINPDTVNTIRVIAMRDKDNKVVIPYANIRIGRKGADVDNFCSGGMTAAINVSNGEVISLAYDKDLNMYEFHPDTKVKIKGFIIPKWKEIIDKTIEVMSIIPNSRYIGWDVTISKNYEICIIEGNHNPEARILQIALNKGLRKEYENILGAW